MQRKRDIVTGIDIGTHSIRVVVAAWQKDEPLPRIIGTGISESRGLRHGYIVDKEEAAKSIQAAVAKAEKISGIKIRRAFVSAGGIGLEGITGMGASMVASIDGIVSDTDITKAIEASEANLREPQNKRIIHIIPVSYKLDGKEVLGHPRGMKGVKIEVKILFITATAQHINDVILAVEEAGIEVEDVFPSPLAAAYVTLTRQQKTAGCVLANIGAETVSIVVFENNIPVSLKVFAIGSTDITNDIALGLKISLDEAENIKLGDIGTDIRSPQKRKLDDIIGARLTDIFELIEHHLKKIDRNGLLPAGIIITGGGSGVNSIAELAKSALRLPSRIGYPAFGKDPKTVQNGTDKSSAFASEVKNVPAWTVAYGLCILGFTSSKEEAHEWKNSFKDIKDKTIAFFKQFLP
ncbi:MAG: cell division protein FtsA [Parcubacteria group bacterium]|nr:cell division protein FtsA [Parcubacteria group bacterium]